MGARWGAPRRATRARPRPVPLALEGVRREQHLATAVGRVETSPVDAQPGAIQAGQALQDLRPLVLIPPQRRQPQAGTRGEPGAGHPEQRRVRTDLDEHGTAELIKGLDAGVELDGLADVSEPVVGFGDLGTGGPPGDVGDQPQPRSTERHRRQHRRERVDHRLDQRRMKRMRHPQRLNPHPRRRKRRSDLVNHPTNPRDHRVPDTIDRRHRHPIRNPNHRRLNLGNRRKDRRHRPTRRQLTHQPGPLDNQPQPVLDTEHPSHRRRHVLTQRMPDHRLGTHPPRQPQLGQRKLDRKQRRLREPRLPQHVIGLIASRCRRRTPTSANPHPNNGSTTPAHRSNASRNTGCDRYNPAAIPRYCAP